MRDYEQLLQARQLVGGLGALDFLIERSRGSQRQFDLTSPLEQVLGSSQVNCNFKRQPLISVVMTAFNSSDTIEKSIQSVLDQSISDLELLVVDDCSSDDTASVVEETVKKDSRVKLLRCYTNRGTYWSKNLGILHAKGEYIALHDSDDTSEPQRLAAQLQKLRASSCRICYTNWIRVDESGGVVLNRGLRERLGYPTAMFHRSLVEQLGFFDSVRVAGDDEFHKRIIRVFGSDAVAHVKKPLYIAPLSPSSLTGRNPVFMDLRDPKDPMSFLSDIRRHYVESYSEWHNSGQPLVMPFPLRKRPFEVPKEIQVDAFQDSERVVVSLASIPERKGSLEVVINDLVPQVDELHVHLNGYSNIPSFLRQRKIEVTTCQELGDLKDNGKFSRAVEYDNCFHFTVDDDLVYPKFYVNYLLAKMLQYNRRAVVGLHGTEFCHNFKRYHDGKSRRTLSFYRANENDFIVDLLGTGVCAYHTDVLTFSIKDAPVSGMVDIWFAIKAKQHAVPMVCVQRGSGWVYETPGAANVSLYSEYLERDQMQSQLVLDNFPWHAERLNSLGVSAPVIHEF